MSLIRKNVACHKRSVVTLAVAGALLVGIKPAVYGVGETRTPMQLNHPATTAAGGISRAPGARARMADRIRRIIKHFDRDITLAQAEYLLGEQMVKKGWEFRRESVKRKTYDVDRARSLAAAAAMLIDYGHTDMVDAHESAEMCRNNKQMFQQYLKKMNPGK